MRPILIFFVVQLLWAMPAAAQQQYYGYGQTQYPAYQQYPAQQYYGYQGYGYAPPVAQPYYQQQYPQQYPPSPLPTEESVKDKPIEIYLGKQMGRWGDYWFRALGGMKSHPTPKGTFTVKARHKEFYSRKYEAEMPRSVFFTEQCAIHVGSLRVKSHGCIHVDWEAGELIYALAKTGKTKVKVYN